jgi:sporulation protein YlmC with PRC-barrel domain
MNKNFASAAIIGGLLAFGSVAQAAESTSHTIGVGQMRASKVIGASVYDLHNQKIGDVKDLVLDKSGKVADVVVDVGAFLGMGGKNVAVHMSDIKTDNNRLTLDRTKSQLQQVAEYRLTDRDTGAGSSASPVTGGTAGSSMAPSK